MAIVADNFSDVIAVNDVGVWRVKGTRVSVDSVLHAFNNDGASPEEIAWQFDSLDLKKVYSVINYYLHNREKVDQYLFDSRKANRKIFRQIDKDFPRAALKEKLVSRRNSK